MDPRESRQLLESALALHRDRKLTEAEQIYRKVLAAEPNNADALHLLGLLAVETGHTEHGVNLLRRAIIAAPREAAFQRDLGQALAQVRRHAEAANAFVAALNLDPNDPIAYSSLGESMLALGRGGEAIEAFRRAEAVSSGKLEAKVNLAYALHRAGRTDEGVTLLRALTTSHPAAPEPWARLADVLWECHKYRDALAPAARAAQLRPDSEHLVNLHGNTLQVAAEFEAAADAYRRVLAMNPDNFDAFSNLALTLLKMGRAEESLRMYDEALQRWPTQTTLLANRSLALLTLGDFERGLDEYEARWDAPAFAHYKRFPQPRWTGEPLDGRTLLLTTEQGAGDTIQFIRYARLLRSRGAGRVVFPCPNDLAELAAAVEGIDVVLKSDDPVPDFDLHAPLASLPNIFDTKLDTIPADVPYLRAAPSRVQEWRQQIAGDAKVKVAIAWAGSPLHQNDAARSCALSDFAPPAKIEGVSFYSIQKGAAAAQLASPPPGMNITDLSPQLNDFADTAAALENLDLLISVDTSVVHLAGALARPVWVLLAAGPDWRWMLERGDSPWYPTMRLFRQPRPGDWKSVFAHVAEALETFVKEKRR